MAYASCAQVVVKVRCFSQEADRALPDIYPQRRFVEAGDSCAQSPGCRASIPAGKGRSGAAQAAAVFLLKNEASKLKTKEKRHEKQRLPCSTFHFCYSINSNKAIMYKSFKAIFQENATKPSFWLCTRSMATL